MASQIQWLRERYPNMIAQEGQDQQAHDPVRYARDQRRDEEERYPSMAPEPEDRPKYALETRNGQVIWK